MARDDCMYDYLRPSDCWTANPWAYSVRTTSEISTVCDKATERAEPLYYAVNGNICMYIVGKKYPEEVCERFEKELRSLYITKTKIFGDVGDADYEESAKTERLTASRIIVKDGAIIGGYDYAERYAKINGFNRKCYIGVFLPLSGEKREIAEAEEVTQLTPNGEEVRRICRTFSSLTIH